MYSEDPLKNVFLTSLSDQQMGFFCAHECSVNLEDLLCDVITPIQMGLFEKWKDSKKADTTTMQSTNFESIVNGKTSTSFQPPNIPTAAPPNMQETDLRELKRYMDLQIESKVNDVRKEMQTQRIINFEESTQTEQLEELGKIQQLQRKLSTAIIPCKLEEYQKNKEIELLCTMENWQIGLFYAYNNRSDYSQLMGKVLDRDQYKQFKEWLIRKVISIPFFIDSQIDARQRGAFQMLLNTRNREAVDSWMELFPQLQDEYQHWRKKHMDHFTPTTYINLPEEVVTKIKTITKNDMQTEKSAKAAVSEQSDLALFRDRQGSYTKMMVKEHIGNELNLPTDIQSRLNKLREDGKNRSSHSDSAAYASDFTDHPELTEDKKTLIHNEVNNFYENPNIVIAETAPPSEDPDNRLEIPITTGYFKELKDKALERFVDLGAEIPITTGYFKELKDKALERLPAEVNILLLGETGVGKSTFLSSVCNYLMYNSPEEALTNGVQVLTPVHYILYDNDRNPTQIIEGPDGLMQQNFDERTLDPQIHEFLTELPNGAKKLIRLLDTPGVGDEQGMEADKLNFPKTMEKLKEFEHINAICILMPSNQARMSTMFRYCINELLTQLDKSVKNNIFFCFTSSRQTMYRFGETVPTLQRIFNEWKVDIPVNIFLDKVAETNPVNINNTLNLNETRKFLERIFMPLVEILKLHVANKQLLERKLKIVLKSSYPETSTVLTKPNYILDVVPLDRPQMVCTSAKCTKTTRLGTEHKVCHRGCIVREPNSRIPHPELEFCREIQNGYCKKCDCSWQYHMHQTEIYVTKEGKTPQRCGSKQDEKKAFEKEIRDIEMEIDTILSSCARFFFFIARESMFGGHDVFREAMDQVIREVSAVKYAVDSFIKSKESKYSLSSLDETKESKLRQELIHKKTLYQQSLAENQKKTVDVDTIADTIETLKQLPSWKSVVDATENNFKRYQDEILSKETEHDRF